MTNESDTLNRTVAIEKEIVVLRQRVDDHLRLAGSAWEKNSISHDAIIIKLEESLRWQTRVKIIIGTAATIIGAILMLVYHYAPWIWDALPKHGHTH